MGYVPTTNYGFQKPEKTNAFNLDDLSNALDKIDETIKNVDDKVQDAKDDIEILKTENQQQDTNISSKVDKNQGTENAGKILSVSSDSMVTLADSGKKQLRKTLGFDGLLEISVVDAGTSSHGFVPKLTIKVLKEFIIQYVKVGSGGFSSAVPGHSMTALVLPCTYTCVGYRSNTKYFDAFQYLGVTTFENEDYAIRISFNSNSNYNINYIGDGTVFNDISQLQITENEFNLDNAKTSKFLIYE